MLPELSVSLATKLQAAPLALATQATNDGDDAASAFAAVLDALSIASVDTKVAATAGPPVVPAVIAMPAAAPATLPPEIVVSATTSLAVTATPATLPTEIIPAAAMVIEPAVPALFDDLIAALEQFAAVMPAATAVTPVAPTLPLVNSVFAPAATATIDSDTASPIEADAAELLDPPGNEAPQSGAVPATAALIAGFVEVLKSLKAEIVPASNQPALMAATSPLPPPPPALAKLPASTVAVHGDQTKFSAPTEVGAVSTPVIDVATTLLPAAPVDAAPGVATVPVISAVASVSITPAVAPQDASPALAPAPAVAVPAPLKALTDKLLALAQSVRIDAPAAAAKVESAARAIAALPPDIASAFAAAIKITGKSGPQAVAPPPTEPNAAPKPLAAAPAMSLPAPAPGVRVTATLPAAQLPQPAVAASVLATASTVEPRHTSKAAVSSAPLPLTAIAGVPLTGPIARSPKAGTLPLPAPAPAAATVATAAATATPASNPSPSAVSTAPAPPPQIPVLATMAVAAITPNSPAAVPASAKPEPKPKSAVTAAVAIAAPVGNQTLDTAVAGSAIAPTVTGAVQHTAQTLAAHTTYQPPFPQPNLPALAGHFLKKLGEGASSFEIRLDPSDLGRIDVKLDIDGKGGIIAKMLVEKPETLDLLQRDQRSLERALQQAGLDTQKTSLEFSLKQNGSGFSGGAGPGQQGHQAFGRPGAKSDDTEIPAPAGNPYRVTGPAGGVNLFV